MSTERRLRLPGIAYGGDYNPEQWPEEVWAEDMRLMREAGVTMVSVGIFSWALLEPAEGRYDFSRMDRLLALLHENGIAADLATPTACPPAWFFRAHPEALPVDRDGRTLSYGSRQTFCPSSPAYRTAALRIAGVLAERYADHPAVAMWHVHNEYGCHNAACYCDTSAAAFRTWLKAKYGNDLDALNHAWGTTFWSQWYYDWEEIIPPRATGADHNPTHQLDWRRFCSDELLSLFTAERDVLRRAAPDIPATTNFMVVHNFDKLDYWRWAPELDIVSNDHYLQSTDPESEIDIALSGDLVRSLAGGAPWLLMEHSTGAVNWQPVNRAKAPGEMRRNALAHVAHGADGIAYFQWRAAKAGAEQWHSAMLPHAGTDSQIWRDVVRLGADLKALAEVRGSTSTAQVAVVWDWNARWAMELPSQPSGELRFLDLVRDWYGALWRAGVAVDFVRPDADLSAYRLVLAPSLYLVDDAGAANLAGFAERGGTLAVGFHSGAVDENCHVRLGGYPGAFRDVLGVCGDELFPLLPGETLHLTGEVPAGATATLWSERVRLAGAKSIASFEDGPLTGIPAVTRHTPGDGTAWYLATRPDPATLAALLDRICDEAGVQPVLATPLPGIEAVRRGGADADYLFLIDHGGSGAEVPAEGVELLTGKPVNGSVTVPPGGVAVVREQH
ncbi:beta-galactosidase [Streptomyces ipomoeae]|uniref:beta-galactosidase n=1 Tax=Streptomyces ipomoeae TaxID=103232 RepID=UPI00114760D1|nr:beta-galactosidase [Streptomyces ipomoeae]MDX2826729.1 beta-galactosidase [Streptomyces ipomoeae]MDX2875335.1 beta-galactosidase [Streptomyces ipomoeae]TQE20186.1 beta-galactosidase [Streptomyces ipomoeae]